MELVKSKGFVIFFTIVLSLTVINSINTRKFEKINNDSDENYITMNVK